MSGGIRDMRGSGGIKLSRGIKCVFVWEKERSKIEERKKDNRQKKKTKTNREQAQLKIQDKQFLIL